MSIRIIADSTADIGEERAKEWGVTLVPLKVLFGEEEFRDGIDLSLDGFYERLVREEKLPTTSQPAPDAFVRVFEEVKAAGDQAVVITISSALSGTYQSALLAKELCEYDEIYIVDSCQVTLSFQLLVRRALELKNQGLDAAAIAQTLEKEKSRYRLYAVIGDLTYLEKGGRLSRVGTVAGTMLNLKPVITVTDEGVVRLAGMARGMNGAFAKLLKLTEADGGMDQEREFAVGYTGDRQTLEPFAAYLSSRLDMSRAVESRIGTVIGTHGGPGCSVLGCILK